MIHRLCLIAGLFALLLAVIPLSGAKAQSSRLYFAGSLGLNTFSKELDFTESVTPATGNIEFANAVSFAGAMGLRLNRQWRVEGEASWRRADTSSINIDGNGAFDLNGDLTTWLYMLNIYYDFNFEWEKIQPYLSAGVGFAHHSGQFNDTSGFASDADDGDMGFAWQMGGGLKYRMSDDMALSGGYRYLGTTDPNLDGYEMEFGTHEWRLGLEYDIPVGLFK